MSASDIGVTRLQFEAFAIRQKISIMTQHIDLPVGEVIALLQAERTLPGPQPNRPRTPQRTETNVSEIAAPFAP
jgi:hypothetical protein